MAQVTQSIRYRYSDTIVAGAVSGCTAHVGDARAEVRSEPVLPGVSAQLAPQFVRLPGPDAPIGSPWAISPPAALTGSESWICVARPSRGCSESTPSSPGRTRR